jgi:hypothetical protein
LTSFIFGGLSVAEGDTLSHRLALVELQNQMKEEFACR